MQKKKIQYAKIYAQYNAVQGCLSENYLTSRELFCKQNVHDLQ